MTMTLGKAGNLRHSAFQLCRVPWARHSARKIKKKLLFRVPTYNTRQRKSKKKRKQALPSARCGHSAKHLKINKKNTFLCRVPTRGTRQRGRHRDLAVTAAFLCRVPSWHSENPLPSVQHAELSKEAFVVKGYADSSLPSAALGKGFAECNCTRQSTRL